MGYVVRGAVKGEERRIGAIQSFRGHARSALRRGCEGIERDAGIGRDLGDVIGDLSRGSDQYIQVGVEGNWGGEGWVRTGKELMARAFEFAMLGWQVSRSAFRAGSTLPYRVCLDLESCS